MKTQITEFLDFLVTERGLAQNTLTAYAADLTRFLEFLEANAVVEWSHVTDATVNDFIKDIHEREYTSRTLMRKLSSLRTFFQFLIDDGLLTNNPLGKLRMPRSGRPIPKTLTLNEIDTLLAQMAASKKASDVRDYAMFELMYAGGLRVSEVVNLNTGDIDFDTCSVKVVGKGSKTRIIPIYEQALIAIKAYTNKVRAKLMKPDKSSTALFLNARGERLTRQCLNWRLKVWGQRANIKSPLSPHYLRHSFASHLLNGGASLRHVQDILGHSSIKTTQIYTALNVEDLRREYEQAHPRR
jgi:integrase/recombinase XerD